MIDSPRLQSLKTKNRCQTKVGQEEAKSLERVSKKRILVLGIYLKTDQQQPYLPEIKR